MTEPSERTDGSTFDALLARELEDPSAETESDVDPEIDPEIEAVDETENEIEESVEVERAAETTAAAPARIETCVDDPASVPPRTGPLTEAFWDLHDLANAEAELATVPAAAVVAVVGPLDAVGPVVERCRDGHWMGHCDVFVLTKHRVVPDHPDWTVVGQPSDLVAVLEEGGSDFPLLVLDVPCDLPAFVRPLVARLRDQGVGLVHYVLDDDPADEDLATWHGELGRPSVLDLAGSIDPGRVLELVDRGEPVVSVAGLTLTTELLLALRIDELATVAG